MKLADLKPGDRCSSLYDDGWHGSLIYAEIIRVNRVTVTIRDEHNRVYRVNPDSLEHKLTDTEKERSFEWFPEAVND